MFSNTSMALPSYQRRLHLWRNTPLRAHQQTCVTNLAMKETSYGSLEPPGSAHVLLIADVESFGVLLHAYIHVSTSSPSLCPLPPSLGHAKERRCLIPELSVLVYCHRIHRAGIGMRLHSRPLPPGDLSLTTLASSAQKHPVTPYLVRVSPSEGF